MVFFLRAKFGSCFAKQRERETGRESERQRERIEFEFKLNFTKNSCPSRTHFLTKKGNAPSAVASTGMATTVKEKLTALTTQASETN